MQIAFKHFAIALAVGVVLLMGCSPDDPDTYTLKYALTLYGEPGEFYAVGIGSFCYGVGGYSDISQGRQVKVLDGNGSIIGVAEFSYGEYQKDLTKGVYDPRLGGRDGQESCTFSADIEVPYADFYQIEGRGNYTVTFDELTESDWVLSLSLGEER